MPDTALNEHPPFPGPQPVELRAADLRLLGSAAPAPAHAKEGSKPRHPVKLRVEDYLRLSEAGAFEGYGRTELIDGVVYAMNPQHRPHGFAKDELAYRLRRALEAMGSDLHVATQQSVAMAPHNQPEPDIILTTEPRGLGAIPAASVALLVEVAHTSVDHDLLRKAPVYASRGVPEYWVVDVNAGLIRQMWSPRGNAYAAERDMKLGEPIEAMTIEGLVMETSGIA